MTYQSGASDTVRQNFLSNGNLPNTQDTNYRAINDNYLVLSSVLVRMRGFRFLALADYFAANDLGNVGSAPITTLYTIVHAQKNAIYFDGANGNVSVPSLWTSYFDSDLALVGLFYKDYSTEVGSIDHTFAVDSLAAGGQDYLTITSLSAHQAFGAVQLYGTASKPYRNQTFSLSPLLDFAVLGFPKSVLSSRLLFFTGNIVLIRCSVPQRDLL
jgi:hypothetical protein